MKLEKRKLELLDEFAAFPSFENSKQTNWSETRKRRWSIISNSLIHFTQFIYLFISSVSSIFKYNPGKTDNKFITSQ